MGGPQTGLPPHQMGPGVHNGVANMANMNVSSQNLNQTFHGNHNQMHQYNSNAIPFGNGGMNMQNMGSSQQPSPQQSANNHHHNQTGSNYDELPLEFIHNMGNQSSVNTNNILGQPSPNINPYPGPGPKQSVAGGPGPSYEEINWQHHDDNLSSAPSNPDSFAVCYH